MRKSEWIELRGNALWTGGVRISEVDPVERLDTRLSHSDIY